jgi:hypothetical protein
MHTGVRSRSELLCRLWSTAPKLRRCAGSCAVVCLLTIAGCLISGCQDVETTSLAEARSPDGRWVASAIRKQHGGPGTAGDYTEIYLKQTDVQRAPTEILTFSVGELMSQSGGLNLTMKWQSPSRLEVTYNGRAATLQFQVVKCGGIDISTRDVSEAGSNQ